ncbi:hypothetical protein IGI04_013534 [Brassica rapa subsp. trilocularis]|uniref:Uncharacterized protein n=1 Tax=Brassica rapa subsp. trilocularis TaxID=1813537 RepID=A0ABQ7N939_BRACM|nr:hypothetical protein IGI04_013534 [Brassica rapa subsp. trilocularis]
MHMIFFFLELMKIFRRNSDGYLSGRRNFLGIFSFNRANKPPNISRKLKLKILKEFRRKISPSEYSNDIFLGIFRGLSNELVVLGVSSEFDFLGIPSEISEDFRGKMNFRGVISEDFFRRYVVGIPLFRRHTDDFFPQYIAVFLQ